jgi:drug/metabolite transporter (DMT)-like permease
MSPLRRGTLLAVLSALAFGASVPLIRTFGRDAGPWTTAALLYAGAALVGFAGSRSAAREAPPRGGALVRIAVAALLGAALAPALLAWGLQQTSALSGSLALAFESAVTVLLAAAFLREHVGARALVALFAASLGAVLLAFGGAEHSSATFSIGTLAVLLATVLWAVDSTITGSLARFDPGRVTFWKCALGASLSGVLAVALHERHPSALHGIALLLVGAVGYGVSLRWYLMAQRAFGAARTASIFALAPFAGALIAVAMGDRPTVAIALAAVVFLLAVYLHATERHGHEHAHPRERHEHAHAHDDAHHDHVHPGDEAGVSHSHDHDHDGRTHVHPHSSDFHHVHEHETL